jgi:hypothetical protein
VFRDRFYARLGRRADALFELCDAILTAGRVPSPPHLSLVSVHRRGWGSLCAALSKGRNRFGSAQGSAGILRPRCDGHASLRG